MLRKLCLTGLLQLVDRGSAFQVMIGCSISLMFYGVHQRVQPYVKPEANVLKALVEGQIFLTFLISFILRVKNIETERLGPSFYGIVLMVSLTLVVLAAVALAAAPVWRKLRFRSRLLEGVEFASLATTSGDPLGVEPPSIWHPTNSDGHFDGDGNDQEPSFGIACSESEGNPALTSAPRY
jgi:hypothetical protein